jgi:hypothetical protein
VILVARRRIPSTRTRVGVARSRVTRARLFVPDGRRARSEATDELVAPVEDELPVEANVATDPEGAVGGAGALLDGLGIAGVVDGLGAGVGGGDTVGTGTGGGGIVGVGTGRGAGAGAGGGGVGTGSETVGRETVIGGRPTSPSACAESTPAAAAAVETARVRANFVSRRTLPYARRTEVRPLRLRASVNRARACSSAGERPLHTREVTGSIPVTPIAGRSPASAAPKP